MMAPVFFGTANAQFLDGELAQFVEDTRAAAYEQGHRDGVAAGRAQMTDMARRIEAALQMAAADAERMRAAMVAEVLHSAFAVAEYATGVQPIADATVLTERIQRALETLDDEQVTIGVNPADWDAVASNLQLPRGITIDRDPTLQPGEALMRGTWSSIDLTREAALSVAREVLS